MWISYCKDKEFFQFFLDIFVKRNPSREYFWKVLAAVRLDDFKAKVGDQFVRIVAAKKSGRTDSRWQKRPKRSSIS